MKMNQMNSNYATKNEDTRLLEMLKVENKRLTSQDTQLLELLRSENLLLALQNENEQIRTEVAELTKGE